MITTPFSQPTSNGSKLPRTKESLEQDIHYLNKKIQDVWGSGEEEPLIEQVYQLESELSAL